jgi:hypothetical protein
VRDDAPLDPFADDPRDLGAELGPEDEIEPLTPDEREDVLADLEDLEVFEALLAPRGVRGLVVDCQDCEEQHFFAWDLLRGNLKHLLDQGQPRVHEPAYSPDPSEYVSWDYARGYADAILAADDD